MSKHNANYIYCRSIADIDNNYYIYTGNAYAKKYVTGNYIIHVAVSILYYSVIIFVILI